MTILERLAAHGIRRRGSARRGFRYSGAHRARVSRADRARIASLRIPPAWTDVTIHPSPTAAVQAVGRDRAGRWQYLYHASQIARRERRKRERLVRFIRALPALRKVVARDLAKTGLPRERVVAGAVRILATCFLRPGSQVYATENGSYGLATLRRRHVAVRGDTVRFRFQGKSRRPQDRELRDRRVARLVRELIALPGEVFKFRNGDGAIVDVTTAHINAYIREHMGGAFSAKDFRTWAGSLLCACALARAGTPAEPDAKAQKRTVAAAIREVAHHLGNTPAVCRTSYVFPAVLTSYAGGRVLPETLNGTEPLRNATRRLERCERGLLALLR